MIDFDGASLDAPLTDTEFARLVRAYFATPAGQVFFNRLHVYRERLKEHSVTSLRGPLTSEQRANLDGQCQVIALIIKPLSTEGMQHGSDTATIE